MLYIYVDGSVKDGKMYLAVFSTSKSLSAPLKIFKKIGPGFAHTAEEEALYFCLKTIQKMNIKDDITIFSDHYPLILLASKLVKPRNLKTFPKIMQIKNLVSQKNIILKWIPRNHNKAHSIIAIGQKKNTNTHNLVSEIQDNSNCYEEKILKDQVVKLKNEIIKKDTLIESLTAKIKKFNHVQQGCLEA